MEEPAEGADFEAAQVQKLLDEEKTKVEEQRSVLLAERQTMRTTARQLDLARWQALSSLESEMRSVQDLLLRASEVQLESADCALGSPSLNPPAALREVCNKHQCKRSAHSSNCETAAIVRDWSEVSPSSVDLEAGGAFSPLLASADKENFDHNFTHQQSPGKKECGSISGVAGLALVVLTRGVARRLMEELASHEQQLHSQVLQDFGFGDGASAQQACKQAMLPHLRQDAQLREQWQALGWC